MLCGYTHHITTTSLSFIQPKVTKQYCKVRAARLYLLYLIHYSTSKSTSSASRQPSSTIVTPLKPLSDQHSQISRLVSKSSRPTSKDWSPLLLKDQAKSRYHSISTSRSSSSTGTKSRTLNDRSPIFSFVQTPPSLITTSSHTSNTRESINTRTSSQSNTNSPSSPQGDLRQWISELYVSTFVLRITPYVSSL